MKIQTLEIQFNLIRYTNFIFHSIHFVYFLNTHYKWIRIVSISTERES